MPAMTLRAACLIALLLMWPLRGASAAQSIQRCTNAEGVTVYTDKPCELLRARPRLAAPASAPSGDSSDRAALAAYSGRQCPQRLSELVDEIALAIRAADTNRLAALYWWGGHGNATASRLLERLEAMTRRPLVDIAPVYPAQPPAAAPPAPAWIEATPGTSALPAAAPPAEPVAPSRPRPYALRIEQVLANSATPASTLLHLRRQYGCFWISF